eukprot:SAG11_NODE_940_length_6465_cov_16.053566_3_plen_108_part_00
MASSSLATALLSEFDDRRGDNELNYLDLVEVEQALVEVLNEDTKQLKSALQRQLLRNEGADSFILITLSISHRACKRYVDLERRLQASSVLRKLVHTEQEQLSIHMR